MALSGTFQGHVVLDPQKLADLLRSEQGPVARRLIADGQIVKMGAQDRVGVYKPPAPVPGSDRLSPRERLPGTLRDSIVARFVNGGEGGFAVMVGSEDPIALLHHEGTVPHGIRPRVKKILAFIWQGAVTFRMYVNHPGTRPNRYLTDSLGDLTSRY